MVAGRVIVNKGTVFSERKWTLVRPRNQARQSHGFINDYPNKYHGVTKTKSFGCSPAECKIAWSYRVNIWQMGLVFIKWRRQGVDMSEVKSGIAFKWQRHYFKSQSTKPICQGSPVYWTWLLNGIRRFFLIYIYASLIYSSFVTSVLLVLRTEQ